MGKAGRKAGKPQAAAVRTSPNGAGATSPPSAARWPTLASAACIVLAALATYHNSFSGPFIFDDVVVAENLTIHRLWPIWETLFPPDKGFATDRRPVTNLSLAVNYALGGTSVRGYHVFNLAAHLLAGLAFFGVARRTLRLRLLGSPGLAAAATPLALIAAILWTVHPLQTNAVTYIVQRTEVLAGLFYLVTIYCVLRGAETARPGRWYLAAVVSCFLAMGSKESAVSAPLVILLYDRLFLAGSWREVRKRRGWLHLGLMSAWLVPAFYVVRGFAVVATLRRGHYIGSGEANWLDYAMAQFESIVLYLRLSFWPRPLVLDYGPGGVKTIGEVALYAAFVVALIAATLVCLWRRPAIGFLGVWFFAILAPSSSIVPLHSEWAAEKRMYLPLASVVLLTVIGAYRLGMRWRDRPTTPASRRNAGVRLAYLGIALAGAAVVALGLVSVRRNEDYRSDLAIWQDTVDKCPRNPRAHNNLGVALAARKETDAAIAQYETAFGIEPDYAMAHNNLGLALAERGQIDAAVAQYERAVEIEPGYAEAYNNLGIAMAAQGRPGKAVVQYEKAIEIRPDYAAAHNNLGRALLGMGEIAAAIGHFERALELKHDYADAHYNLGNALAGSGKLDSAIAHYERALQIRPDFAMAHHYLGCALAGRGEVGPAMAQFQKALELKPDDSEARRNLELLRGLRTP